MSLLSGHQESLLILSARDIDFKQETTLQQSVYSPLQSFESASPRLSLFAADDMKEVTLSKG